MADDGAAGRGWNPFDSPPRQRSSETSDLSSVPREVTLGTPPRPASSPASSRSGGLHRAAAAVPATAPQRRHISPASVKGRSPASEGSRWDVEDDAWDVTTWKEFGGRGEASSRATDASVTGSASRNRALSDGARLAVDHAGKAASPSDAREQSGAVPGGRQRSASAAVTPRERAAAAGERSGGSRNGLNGDENPADAIAMPRSPPHGAVHVTPEPRTRRATDIRGAYSQPIETKAGPAPADTGLPPLSPVFESRPLRERSRPVPGLNAAAGASERRRPDTVVVVGAEVTVVGESVGADGPQSDDDMESHSSDGAATPPDAAALFGYDAPTLHSDMPQASMATDANGEEESHNGDTMPWHPIDTLEEPNDDSTMPASAGWNPFDSPTRAAPRARGPMWTPFDSPDAATELHQGASAMDNVELPFPRIGSELVDSSADPSGGRSLETAIEPSELVLDGGRAAAPHRAAAGGALSEGGGDSSIANRATGGDSGTSVAVASSTDIASSTGLEEFFGSVSNAGVGGNAADGSDSGSVRLVGNADEDGGETQEGALDGGGAETPATEPQLERSAAPTAVAGIPASGVSIVDFGGDHVSVEDGSNGGAVCARDDATDGSADAVDDHVSSDGVGGGDGSIGDAVGAATGDAPDDYRGDYVNVDDGSNGDAVRGDATDDSDGGSARERGLRDTGGEAIADRLQRSDGLESAIGHDGRIIVDPGSKDEGPDDAHDVRLTSEDEIDVPASDARAGSEPDGSAPSSGEQVGDMRSSEEDGSNECGSDAPLIDRVEDTDAVDVSEMDAHAGHEPGSDLVTRERERDASSGDSPVGDGRAGDELGIEAHGTDLHASGTRESDVGASEEPGRDALSSDESGSAVLVSAVREGGEVDDAAEQSSDEHGSNAVAIDELIAEPDNGDSGDRNDDGGVRFEQLDECDQTDSDAAPRTPLLLEATASVGSVGSDASLSVSTTDSSSLHASDRGTEPSNSPVGRDPLEDETTPTLGAGVAPGPLGVSEDFADSSGTLRTSAASASPPMSQDSTSYISDSSSDTFPEDESTQVQLGPEPTALRSSAASAPSAAASAIARAVAAVDAIGASAPAEQRSRQLPLLPLDLRSTGGSSGLRAPLEAPLRWSSHPATTTPGTEVPRYASSTGSRQSDTTHPQETAARELMEAYGLIESQRTHINLLATRTENLESEILRLRLADDAVQRHATPPSLPNAGAEVAPQGDATVLPTALASAVEVRGRAVGEESEESRAERADVAQVQGLSSSRSTHNSPAPTAGTREAATATASTEAGADVELSGIASDSEVSESPSGMRIKAHPAMLRVAQNEAATASPPSSPVTPSTLAAAREVAYGDGRLLKDIFRTVELQNTTIESLVKERDGLVERLAKAFEQLETAPTREAHAALQFRAEKAESESTRLSEKIAALEVDLQASQKQASIEAARADAAVKEMSATVDPARADAAAARVAAAESEAKAKAAREAAETADARAREAEQSATAVAREATESVARAEAAAEQAAQQASGISRMHAFLHRWKLRKRWSAFSTWREFTLIKKSADFVDALRIDVQEAKAHAESAATTVENAERKASEATNEAQREIDSMRATLASEAAKVEAAERATQDALQRMRTAEGHAERERSTADQRVAEADARTREAELRAAAAEAAVAASNQSADEARSRVEAVELRARQLETELAEATARANSAATRLEELQRSLASAEEKASESSSAATQRADAAEERARAAYRSVAVAETARTAAESLAAERAAGVEKAEKRAAQSQAAAETAAAAAAEEMRRADAARARAALAESKLDDVTSRLAAAEKRVDELTRETSRLVANTESSHETLARQTFEQNSALRRFAAGALFRAWNSVSHRMVRAAIHRWKAATVSRRVALRVLRSVVVGLGVREARIARSAAFRRLVLNAVVERTRGNLQQAAEAAREQPHRRHRATPTDKDRVVSADGGDVHQSNKPSSPLRSRDTTAGSGVAAQSLSSSPPERAEEATPPFHSARPHSPRLSATSAGPTSRASPALSAVSSSTVGDVSDVMQALGGAGGAAATRRVSARAARRRSSGVTEGSDGAFEDDGDEAAGESVRAERARLGRLLAEMDERTLGVVRHTRAATRNEQLHDAAAVRSAHLHDDPSVVDSGGDAAAGVLSPASGDDSGDTRARRHSRRREARTGIRSGSSVHRRGRVSGRSQSHSRERAAISSRSSRRQRSSDADEEETLPSVEATRTPRGARRLSGDWATHARAELARRSRERLSRRSPQRGDSGAWPSNVAPPPAPLTPESGDESSNDGLRSADWGARDGSSSRARVSRTRERHEPGVEASPWRRGAGPAEHQSQATPPSAGHRGTAGSGQGATHGATGASPSRTAVSASHELARREAAMREREEALQRAEANAAAKSAAEEEARRVIRAAYEEASKVRSDAAHEARDTLQAQAAVLAQALSRSEASSSSRNDSGTPGWQSGAGLPAATGAGQPWSGPAGVSGAAAAPPQSSASSPFGAPPTDLSASRSAESVAATLESRLGEAERRVAELNAAEASARDRALQLAETQARLATVAARRAAEMFEVEVDAETSDESVPRRRAPARRAATPGQQPSRSVAGVAVDAAPRPLPFLGNSASFAGASRPSTADGSASTPPPQLDQLPTGWSKSAYDSARRYPAERSPQSHTSATGTPLYGHASLDGVRSSLAVLDGLTPPPRASAAQESDGGDHRKRPYETPYSVHDVRPRYDGHMGSSRAQSAAPVWPGLRDPGEPAAPPRLGYSIAPQAPQEWHGTTSEGRREPAAGHARGVYHGMGGAGGGAAGVHAGHEPWLDGPRGAATASSGRRDRVHFEPDAASTRSDARAGSTRSADGAPPQTDHPTAADVSFAARFVAGITVMKHRANPGPFGRGKPQRREMWLDVLQLPHRVCWGDARHAGQRGASFIAVPDIRGILTGQATPTLKQSGNPGNAAVYLSVLGPERTLDLECGSRAERDWLRAGLASLVQLARARPHVSLLPLIEAFEGDAEAVDAAEHAERLVHHTHRLHEAPDPGDAPRHHGY